LSLVAVITTVWACGDASKPADEQPTGDASMQLADAPEYQDPEPTPMPTSVEVTLTPRTGITGVQRVNVAVPLAPGQLADPARVRVLAAGEELAAGRRALARYSDGSVRSVQLQ